MTVEPCRQRAEAGGEQRNNGVNISARPTLSAIWAGSSQRNKVFPFIKVIDQRTMLTMTEPGTSRTVGPRLS
jgi:hypothetical protein